MKALMTWADMTNWDILLTFKPLEGKYGQACIQSEYKQATIVLDSEADFKNDFKHDSHMFTLCHEFAHIWLWDIHNPEVYETNWAYNRLVEGSIEDVAHLLYKRVLKPSGY